MKAKRRRPSTSLMRLRIPFGWMGLEARVLVAAVGLVVLTLGCSALSFDPIEYMNAVL